MIYKMQTESKTPIQLLHFKKLGKRTELYPPFPSFKDINLLSLCSSLKPGLRFLSRFQQLHIEEWIQLMGSPCRSLLFLDLDTHFKDPMIGLGKVWIRLIEFYFLLDYIRFKVKYIPMLNFTIKVFSYWDHMYYWIRMEEEEDKLQE